ncbi:hypothetical protein TNCV_1108981 [Trichonephila clavipes]|nr:hypothetical protein TNCV_1108981 [Trichonephila clavipes]
MPPSGTELARVAAPKGGTGCISGWGTRVWIRISETPQNFAGYCRKEVEWLCVRVPHPDFHFSYKESFLWRDVETLRLTINTRVQLQIDQSEQIFSNQLLDFGNEYGDELPCDLHETGTGASGFRRPFVRCKD